MGLLLITSTAFTRATQGVSRDHLRRITRQRSDQLVESIRSIGGNEMIEMYQRDIQQPVIQDFQTRLRQKWINADKDLLAWTVSDIFAHAVIAVSAFGLGAAL